MRIFPAFIFGLLAISCFGAAVVSATQQTVTVAPGDTLSASCSTMLSATITPNLGTLHCAVPAHPNHWHAPTTHEHGDEPPAWASDFSQQTFGHGIIYGGNEASSPMENSHKHEAFKGVTLQTVAGGEVYWRYHAASNPLDRSAQFHSFEVYYRDTAGNVSFFEGHYDAGDPSNSQARCALPSDQCGSARPIILMNGDKTEQWYMHHGLLSFAVNISGPTTYYGGLAENATAHDQSTWLLTGKLGTGREISTEVFISAAARLAAGLHCANAHGGRGPCDAEHPMRYVIAPTLASDYRTEYNVERISTVRRSATYACPQCQVPN